MHTKQTHASSLHLLSNFHGMKTVSNETLSNFMPLKDPFILSLITDFLAKFDIQKSEEKKHDVPVIYKTAVWEKTNWEKLGGMISEKL